MAVDSSLAVGATGELLETVKKADLTHREGVMVGDPITDAARARVAKTIPDGTDWGLHAYVLGIVSVSNFPASFAVSNFPASFAVSNFPASQAVTGPLTDAQLRAAAVPVSGAFFQGTQPVSAAALPLPAGASTEATLALIKAKTDNIDVALSTRTKPADAQHTIVDSGVITSITNPVAVTGGADHALTFAGDKVDASGSSFTNANLDVLLSTRLKPADTLAGVTTVAAVTSLTQFGGQNIALNTGTRSAGTLRVTVATDDLVPVSNAGLTNIDVALSTRLKPADTLTAVASITTAVTPGTAAANLGKAEDAVHGSGDTGVMALAVRNDTPTTALTNANGDYSPIATDAGGVQWMRKRQLVTYSAAYRLVDATAGQLAPTFTFAANTNKQLGTIYHAASATKTVRIRKVSLIVSTGAAGIFDFEIRALSAATAPATGNPAITPRAHNGASGAAEATCLALPTTAGSLVGADTGTVGMPIEWNSAAAAATANPSGLSGQEIVLYEHWDDSETEPLTMRAGVAEGFAVNARCTAAVALRYMLLIRFTEE